MSVRYLYPCYFDSALTRKNGRRVSKENAVSNPDLSGLIKAVRSAGIKIASEDSKAKHPAYWFKSSGVIKVEYEGSKEELMKKTAQHLRNK